MTASKSTVPATVLILTRNEEKAIERAVRSVAAFSQVIVVDSHSTDATRELAVGMGATVIDFTWDGGYPKKKEWSLTSTPIANDWVLYLDADEVVTEELADEIRQELSCPSDHAAYEMDLDYYFLGKRLRHGRKITKRALVRRDRIRWPRIDDLAATNMWEVEGHYQPVADGSIGRLTHRLAHEDLDPLYDFIDRHNRYSDWEAEIAERDNPDRPYRSQRARRWSRVPFRPVAAFLYCYVARLGFLDGREGLHYAVAFAFYQWQISAKRLELRKQRAR